MKFASKLLQVHLSLVLALILVKSDYSALASGNRTTVTGIQQQQVARNCSAPCSSAEYAFLLQKITTDESVLSSLRKSESDQTRTGALALNNIRPKCVRQLIDLIRGLASGELEMKNLLEFASSSNTINHRFDFSTLRAPVDKTKSKRLEDESCEQNKDEPAPGHLLDEEFHSSQVVDDKSRSLPKLVASVDQWIESLERFTGSREWSSLMKIIKGAEEILNMFIKTPSSSQAVEKSSRQLPEAAPGNNSEQSSDNQQDELLDKLKRNLPVQVQTLTSFLNQLFPWHVWPWNNMDLYKTIDTFLNHGIFTFSKSTAGPERRIDYLSQMLESLFKSMKYDSFPKRCNDWSRVICDLELFHDRLALPPPVDESATNSTERKEQVQRLVASKDNKLTQELTCIMFSSLSMQQFGAKDVDLDVGFDSSELTGGGQATNRSQAAPSPFSIRLDWDKQVRKALRLYSLSREALTDEQWLALSNQLQGLWSKMKITDRVMMVGRVVQLLTNCHMPKEILESALWKDIYKYKNALNQIGDIVIEELNRSSENGKFSIEQLALGSKSLDAILRLFIQQLPQMIESLSKTIVDQLPELVNRFFNEKSAFFKAPCKGYSFSELIPNLGANQTQIMALEELICQQLRTKPSITMVQINNLTNEFLAMAFNFSTFGGSLQSLPKFWGNLDVANSGLAALKASSMQQVAASEGRPAEAAAAARHELDEQASNGTSIVDELAANPRLAQIVAILQSSALDPPEVRAELPELDWVEAGTSVALFYETIQKLLSHEGGFVVFPEVSGFQEELMASVESSRQMFEKFSKRDPISLAAYSLDAFMPIALRIFLPTDSFHGECLSTFRDIFGEMSFEGGPKEPRQWQCAISSINFASHALDQLVRTFNDMLGNILSQMSRQNEGFFKANNSLSASSSSLSSACVLFDGSVTTLMDNLPQMIDLALETVLIASTNSNQQQTSLQGTLCASDHLLDPLGEQPEIVRRKKLREAVCHLLHESSIATCSKALRIDQWVAAMNELNRTWFESSAISVEPSFRAILAGVHEFLELFGKVKPSSMSDGLIARVLNLNSYWTNLTNKIVVTIDKYREKRFEVALQILMPIIFDNLPALSQSSSEGERNETNSRAAREAIKGTILMARAILEYMSKPLSVTGDNGTMLEVGSRNTIEVQVESQLVTLFDWADRYSVGVVETLFRTFATNITKLETLVEHNSSSKFDSNATWSKFCRAPVDTFLEFDLTETANKANLANEARFVELTSAKEAICGFEWSKFRNDLMATVSSSNETLDLYNERQLTRIALTKWGQILDLIFAGQGSRQAQRLPKFLSMAHWQSFQEKLPQLSPLKEEPTNFVWIWQGLDRIVYAADANHSNQTSDALLRIFDQLNCALDAVKGGFTWDNLANIYQDRQDILAAHSTINNGISLASACASTFLAHKKFQKFLNDFVKPRAGLNAFCEMRDRSRLESIFSAPNQEDLSAALESFQELVCDTNLESLAQNINPISVCYQTVPISNISQKTGPFTEIMDRFFKLASLAVLDAKLVDSNDAKPPIFDKSQWSNLRNWWLNQTEVHQGNSGLALTLVRIFQTLDSVNSDHVVWKALFRSVHELSEIAAYLIRAAQIERQVNGSSDPANPSRLTKVKEAAEQFDRALKSNGTSIKLGKQQQLASTLTNVMFPDENNFISFKTFKQLRYIKSISDYFTSNQAAQESICHNISKRSLINIQDQSRFELIGYKLDTNEKLNSLLCHYHSTQWLTTLNIVLSPRTLSLSKKVNQMTKYLSIFTRNYQHNDNLHSFIHSQQMENIEAVANTTVSYLITLSHPFKTLTLSKISNISWHSIPSILDDIDGQLCASKYENTKYKLATYEPKKPKLETLVCKLPSWNMTQVYNYLSENLDLQNLISLVMQHNSTASLLGISTEELPAKNGGQLIERTCITPFKFASKWLRILQESIDELKSKTKLDSIRKCFGSSKKSQSIYSQALRYVKLLHGLMSSINDLNVNNSWPMVKRTWNSISFAILNQSSSSGASVAKV